MAVAPTGLRERKKARTRTLIAETAMDLFAARGFDAVTVAEVAEAAEVGASTVFNYFPTKEDLFYDRRRDVVEHLSRVVRARNPGESFAGACHRDMLGLIAARDWRAGLAPNMAHFYRLVEASPALQARARLMTDQATGLLAQTIAEELAAKPDDVVPATTAFILTGIRTSLLDLARRESLTRTRPKTLTTRLTDATNRSFGLLGGELAELGR
jgi:AcrR family transcriptional regulator